MFVKCLLLLAVFGSLDADYFGISSHPKPCILPRIDHGRVRVRRSTLIKFICMQRYELVGNRYATCKNGDWDTPIPVCVRSGCTVPRVENGLSLPSRSNAWIMYFCLPGYKMVGSPVIYCDGRRWNASAPVCNSNSIEKPSLSCDFEEGLCGWSQDELHDFDWKRINGKTPSSFLNTGPSFDHTLGRISSGYYVYIESSSRTVNDTARLISPVYDSSLASDGCFSFFFHMYGSTCGGLRVYQKPDNISLETILQSSGETKKKYILYEKWGNLGDFWYSSVSTLHQYNIDFQIIIEGIRGSSFTSDIAIDDVAILQGDKCNEARIAGPTPPLVPYIPDSCANRCQPSVTTTDSSSSCGCTGACLDLGNCCPDFFELCMFLPDSTTNGDYDDASPFTQKQVFSTTEYYNNTNSTTTNKTTSKTTTTSTTTTTATPKTTTSTTTTTRRPTTTPRRTTIPQTTKRITTRRPTTIPKTTARKTTQTTTTKFLATERTTKAKTTTKLQTTTAKPTTTAKAATTTPKLQTKAIFTTKSVTELPFGISRTIENHNIYHELVEKKRKEQSVETRKHILIDKFTDVPKLHSGWKITLSIIGLTVGCVGLILALRVARSARGRIALAGLRGRVNNDPEVRYLSRDVDDF